MEYGQRRWNLDDLYPGIGSPEIETALGQLEQMVTALESLRPNLRADIPPVEFVSILERYDAMLRLLSRLGGFGYLSFAQDTQDQQAQTFLARVRQISAETDNRTLFLRLWWKDLEDEAAARLMAISGDYRYWLEALRLQRPYTLSEPEERVVNLKDVNGVAALVTLYDSITNRYAFHLTVDGQERELTRGEIQVYVRDASAELRAAAYQELNRVYARDASILGQIYQYRARDWRSENLDLRGYAAPISVRNLSNNIPDDVVDLLLETCRKNAPLFQRYFRLKARWLGVDKIRRYDIYAPVVQADTKYAFEQASRLVLESYAEFEPRVADLARRVFEENHIDSEIRKGKMSGAFSATIEPALTPWVLTSFQGRVDDVATLAHELGHSVHGLLASVHTGLTQDASLPLAETASTFGEMLLIDHLLAGNPDPRVQRDLLFRQMDDAYATIMRQAYFALFERQANDAVQAGGSVDDLSKVYFDNLAEQFGDSLDLSEDFRVEWVSIPHFFHTPFYVYAYAFGQLLVFSLYQQYRQEGAAFKPRYLEVLAAGGSDAPARILERAGIDIHSPAFWQGGFDVVEGALRRLEGIPVRS